MRILTPVGDEYEDPRVGSVLLDRYRIAEALSSGAMGSVYRAERLGLGRLVAIKFLHPHFAQEPNFIKRFDHEALAMSKLNHPNCISVIDFGIADSPFLVMDYVTGDTLADVIDDEGPLPLSRAIGITRQVLAGLAHAHDQGIIHRDVKAANVMLSAAMGAGDHVHILDFGLAKLRDADLSMTGMVVGTPSYMSPEQASYKQIDGRSDVYSTGVLLFELLTGAKPFQADEAFDIIRRHLEDPPPRLRDRYPEGAFSDALEAVVAKTLEKSPDDRYPSALALSDALAEVAGEETRSSAPVIGARERGPEANSDAKPHSGFSAASTSGYAQTIVASDISRAPRRARARPGRGAPRSGLVLLVAAIAAVGWVAAGAPGVPSGWIDAGRAALDSARSSVGGGAETQAGGEGEPGPASVDTVDDARALAAAGEAEAALRALHDLRRQRPDDAAILHLMGELYAKRGWIEEALTSYAEAVSLDPSYRERADIAAHAIGALGDEATRQNARVLLIKHLGEPALPHLRSAVAEAESPDAAAALRDVVAEIERRAGARPN